jgi:membrane-bound lytic murein transglycosylase A
LHNALKALSFSVMTLLTACSSGKYAEGPKGPEFEIQAATYADMPGWDDDNVSEALQSFGLSCSRILKQPPEAMLGSFPEAGRVADWAAPCRALDSLVYNMDENASAREFFTQYFTPYKVSSNGSDEGLFTGYYEAELNASHYQTEQFRYPIYKKPDDFAKPYLSRAEIESGALQGRGLEIAYVDDAVDLFFMHIQGSGRLKFPDGQTKRVGYAEQNGHAYIAIGKVMLDQGMLQPGNVSAQTIKAWLRENSGQAANQVMNQNPSYIFFAERGDNQAGPIGSHGVPLVAGRSIAIDRSFIPLGTPVWLSTTVPTPALDSAVAQYQRLMIAQDTGGAIKGGIRGDVFFGHGKDAEAMAGYMKNKGSIFLLLPKSAAGVLNIANNFTK